MKKILTRLALLGVTAGFFVGCGQPQAEKAPAEPSATVEKPKTMEKPTEMPESDWQPEMSEPEEAQPHTHGNGGHSH